ncbi:hypothetical protein EYF80_036282 [Liparis tanakae]|uniref:Uncharacterized protein n=1 Tax=Liparis tanakae TaxID=230148 RepID=A0A4Z2GJQ0_9TELE|nr:hypothetical protein EYF80_036282 [Liparis tanakae]
MADADPDRDVADGFQRRPDPNRIEEDEFQDPDWVEADWLQWEQDRQLANSLPPCDTMTPMQWAITYPFLTGYPPSLSLTSLQILWDLAIGSAQEKQDELRSLAWPSPAVVDWAVINTSQEPEEDRELKILTAKLAQLMQTKARGRLVRPGHDEDLA